MPFEDQKRESLLKQQKKNYKRRKSDDFTGTEYSTNKHRNSLYLQCNIDLTLISRYQSHEGPYNTKYQGHISVRLANYQI